MTSVTSIPRATTLARRPAEHMVSRRTVRCLVLVAFIVAYLGLEIASYLPRSATYDEPLHLAAGYAALAKQDHRMDPTHPPLVRMWAALPLLAMPEVKINTGRMDGLDQDAWMPMQNTYAHEFLYLLNDADRLLNWSRLMIVLLGAALGLLVFAWAEEWLGFPTAALTLLFFLLSPNLGAHASLVTTDLGVSVLYFGAIYGLWRACRDFTFGNVAGFVLCFALAIVSKFSAFLLVPTVAILLVLAVRRPGPMTWGRAAALVGLLGVTTWAVIWTVYGFRYAPSDTPGSVLQTLNHPEVREHLPAIAPIVTWIDAHHLLPNAFTQGFLMCFAWSESLPSYLAGEISTAGGWWYYYPVAFLVKTPAVLLVLLAAGLGVLAWRRGRVGDGATAFVLLPPVVYLGFAMSTGINIGLRHILPVYPFVLLTAGVVVWGVLGAAWRTGIKWLALLPLVGFWLAMFAWRYPHTLSHFNLFVGGPANGSEYLVDSNLDWGQHLKRLRQWMNEHRVERINLAYFGIADPSYHGIPCRVLPGARDYLAKRITQPPELPGYVAISATVLSGVYLPPEWRLFYGGFEKLEPITVIGDSLRVYWVERWPEVPVDGEPDSAGGEIDNHARLGEKLLRLGWYQLAIGHFQHSLRARPENGEVLEGLGLALFATDRRREGVDALRRAVELDPEATDRRSWLAGMLLQQGDARGAVAHAQEIVRRLPDNPRSLDFLGVALAQDGQVQAAQRAFERALQLAPGDRMITDHLNRARQPGPPGGAVPSLRRR